MKRKITAIAVMVMASAVGIPALGATHEVWVKDNSYESNDITINKGDTVKWSWLGENHHSVTFDDGVDSGTKGRPNFWSRTFDQYGTYYYHCTVHGLAMSGKVVVPCLGPDCVPEPPRPKIWVPSEAPTVAEAIGKAGDGTVIYLEPGVHVVTETVHIAANDVTIQGARRPTTTVATAASAQITQSDSTDLSTDAPAPKGRSPKTSNAAAKKAKPEASPSSSPTTEPSPSPSSSPTAEPSPSPSPTVEPSPSPSPSPTVEPEPLPVSADEVVIKAKGGFSSAFKVTGDDFSMRSLTIESFRDSAVDVIGAKRFRFEDLRLHINREYGIRSVESRFGVIDNVYVTGSTRAGVSIQNCELCDVTVSGLLSEGNFNGFEALDAGSVILTGSTLRNNGNGVILRTRAKPSTNFQDGVHVYGNQISDNGDPQAPAPSIFRADETQELGSGAGVWISGGWRNVVQANSITGHLYAVAVTSFGSAPMHNRVESNSLSASDKADIGWDGAGVGNCFSNNSGGDATTDPPGLQTTNRCGGTGAPGVPNPIILINLASSAIDNYYCPELGELCPLR